MTGSRRAISSTMSGEPSVEASSTTMISLETGTARTRLSSSATVERSLWQGTMTERTGVIRDILSSRARAAPEPRPSPCPPEPAPASEPGAGAGPCFEHGQAPPFAARGGDEAVGGAIERGELRVRDVVVVEEVDAAAAGMERQRADFVGDVEVGVAIHGLADEDHALAGAEGRVECAQQNLRRLARAPFEIGEEDEVAVAIRDARRIGMEAIGIDAEGDDVDGLGHAAVEETAAIELRRSPDLIHRVCLANPVGRKAVHLEHREADLVFAVIAVEHVARRVRDDDRRMCFLTPRANRVEPRIARFLGLGERPRRAGSVGVAVGDVHAARVEGAEDVARAGRVA